MAKRKAVKPFVLVICDGFGSAPAGLQGNAVIMADTPNLMELWENYPHTELFAHGRHVGLPKHQPGNSEAGHMNIGAGRVIKQDAVYISESIEDGTFFKNTAFTEALRHADKHGTNVHLMGLISSGGSAHSSMDHVHGLLQLCRQHNIADVFVHAFTDGRDGPRFSAPAQVHELEGRMKANERIATLMGRFYAMDRNKNWARTDLAYHAIVNGEALSAPDAETALLQAYNRGETDEFIIPTVIVDEQHQPIGQVKDNDVIIFFNLRSDRARQLTKAFVIEETKKGDGGDSLFKRRRIPKKIRFCAMTDFGPDLPYVLTAYPGRDIKKTLPEALAHLSQLYVAESEKFAHMTFFLNGGYAEPKFGEERLKIESLDIPRFDKQPDMKARELISAVIDRLRTGKYHFVALNIANADMVAHTGNLEASVRAVEVVDECIGRLWAEIKKMNGHLFVSADHGNVEEMIDVSTGAIQTKHSTNPVPFIVAGKDIKGFRELPRGVLADVAPTILDLMGVHQPEEMTGRSLFSD